MPKVKMLVKLSGTRNGDDWPNAGDTLEVSKDESVNLVANGYAEAVKASKKA
jgi:hypothetical protein|tara:strand:- start:472 stop:627 length:156 start_codon:yes stop_codon:yes gene_type:complete